MSEDDSIDRLLEKAEQRLAARCRFPESTYRLQFHKEFTFRDAIAIVPYLRDLGISDCYASPYLKARPGSKHGYDITDHRVLNPEIGSEEDYQAFVAALREADMGQLLDTVPNHMGIAGNENLWWNDVLENGPSSPYAGYFDIDWHPVKPQLRDKVLLPVLGGPYGEVLESGQLQLKYEAGAFVVAYFEHRFPIAPDSYVRVLSLRLKELEQTLGADSPDFMEYGSIVTAAGHLPSRSDSDPARIAERQREKEVLKRRLATLVEKSDAVRQCIEASVQQLNGTVGDSRTFDALDELLNEQSYRLSFWRVASDEINYRRFFDVNELAALSMEKREVFEATHALVLGLVQEGKVTGLRIDHPDGLFDPRQYLEWLQEQVILNAAQAIFESEHPPATDQAGAPQWKDLAGPISSRLRERFAAASADAVWGQPLYVVVEKILGRDEPLAEDWPVQGTTGYDVLNLINGLFVRPGTEPDFSRLYRRFSGLNVSFGDLVYQKKFLIMQVSLSSELHMLATQLDRLSEKNRGSRDFTLNSLRHALREIIACFPVYRSYISSAGIHPRDHLYVQTATVRARRKNPAISASIFDYVRDMLLLRYPTGSASPEEQLRFAGKFQQVTSPVMAKGLEDTTFYDYNRLVSLNEVGGDPGAFGVTLEEFHRRNQERQRLWPRTLIPLSTHDTKRGEDVRARINVLSEIPQEWRKHVLTWAKFNRKHREQMEGLEAPDRNDEYFLYQTLIGAWPLPPHRADAAFVRRIQEYMTKAIHEAKTHTSWINPNVAYDEAVTRFVARILDPRLSERFLADFTQFQRRVGHCGLFNSLSQTLLKFTAPGVADTYQGTELWDFSLVDPDNRRPVDYELRRTMLADLRQRLADPQTDLVALARELTERKEDSRIKLFVTHRLLELRRSLPGVFSAGEYLPVTAAGRRADHLVAFLRQHEGRWALSIAPRLIAGLLPEPYSLPLGPEVWQETVLALPGMAANQRCRNVFTGEVVAAAEESGQVCVPAALALGNFPIALLVGEG